MFPETSSSAESSRKAWNSTQSKGSSTAGSVGRISTPWISVRPRGTLSLTNTSEIRPLLLDLSNNSDSTNPFSDTIKRWQENKGK